MAEALPRYTEARAFATQAALIARHVWRPEPACVGSHVVVLVHGFLAAPAVFDPLRHRITEELGWATRAFGYASFADFEATAQRFAEALESQVPAGSELTLVGHSLGGLLARWYVEELGGAERVRRVVTISTPHHGTRAARLAPFGMGASILPGSDVITRLAQRREGPSLHALVGANDTTVSAASALGCDADSKLVIADVGHNGILYAAHAQDCILSTIAGAGSRRVGLLDS